MKKNSVSGIFTVIPFGLSLVSAYRSSIWLAAATIILIFILVAVLPFCHKRESLWIFILVAAASIPINLFLLSHYDVWMFLAPTESSEGMVYYLALVQYTLILSGFEEIAAGMLGRFLWKRQYRLIIPVKEDEE